MNQHLPTQCDIAIGAALHVAPYTGTGHEWDDFVRAQPGWSHCHLYGWRNVMRDAFGHDTVYLAARVHSQLTGVLPVVRVRSRLFGRFLVSIPFANYGGPLGSDDAIQRMVSLAARIADAERANVLELRSRYALPLSLPVSHRKITVLLDMSGGADALWKRLDGKVRSQVRRPQKDGVTVRMGADQVDPFFQVFAQHMRDLGTPTYPLSFFHSIAREFPDDVLFAVAYHEGKAIACGCGFRWGDEFEITWASALREYNKMSPNMLVYWELMRATAEAGATTFNFGRCTPESGTHKFKRQWGTTDEQLWWYERRAPGASLLQEGSNTAKLGADLWKKLPLRIATALGPRIIRSIPL
ncbi:MAG: FemAB family XrtA/PEP-CTERM system-associated protein [Gemmatimonadaceae bacterium]